MINHQVSLLNSRYAGYSICLSAFIFNTYIFLIMRRTIYIWLPAIMLVYLTAMAFQFKDALLGSGRYFQFYGTIAIELVVILFLYIFLRKKVKMRDDHEDSDRGRS